jgi:hypothetical protein
MKSHNYNFSAQIPLESKCYCGKVGITALDNRKTKNGFLLNRVNINCSRVIITPNFYKIELFINLNIVINPACFHLSGQISFGADKRDY